MVNIEDLRIGTRVELNDGTSGTIEAIFSGRYNGWQDCYNESTFSYVTDENQMRGAEVKEIINIL